MLFNKISVENRTVIAAALGCSGVNVCDYAFADLVGYGDTYSAAFCEIDGFVVLRYCYDGEHFAYSQPFGEGDFSHILPLLEEDAFSRGESLRFFALSEQGIGTVRKVLPDYGVYYERKRDDYVYLRSDLENLHGHKYQAKRNHINKFESEYQWEYRTLCAGDRDECMALVDLWRRERCADKTLPDYYLEEIDVERRCIETQFSLFDALGLMGGAIIVDGAMVAFCYGCELSADTVCVNIEKGDDRYEGVYALLNREFVRHLPPQYIYVNREDDLGLAGLRQAKLSYHPAVMLHKWMAEPMTPLMQQVERLWLKCFPEDSRDDVEQFLFNFFDESNMVCEWDGERLVSMLHIVPFGAADYVGAAGASGATGMLGAAGASGATAYFYAIATDPAYRGRSLATGVIARALDICRERGFASAALIPGTPSLRSWYSRLGFCEIPSSTEGQFSPAPAFFTSQATSIPISFIIDDYNFGTGDPAADIPMFATLAEFSFCPGGP